MSVCKNNIKWSSYILYRARGSYYSGIYSRQSIITFIIIIQLVDMGSQLFLVQAALLFGLVLHNTQSITISKSPTTEAKGAHNSSRNAETYPSDDVFVPVKCSDMQTHCRCPDYAEACRFLLNVEELQTFTSYKYEEEFENLLAVSLLRIKTKSNVRGSAGDTYYLNGRGYIPSLPPPPPNGDNKPPEYGDCYIKNTTITEESFRKQGENGCSVPITIDGTTYRMFIGINGQIPGPTLIVREGQHVHVRVINKLTSEGISVHWHGMHQKETPWMDGVGFVTQPPIIPGAYFDYIFEASPAGTHWYHSHIGAQRTDGLYGALVVMEDKNKLEDMVNIPKNSELVDTPKYHTLSLLDWQRESSLNIFVRIHSTLGFYPDQGVGKVPSQLNNLYLRTHSSDGIEVGPFPYWSGLINGKGRHDENTFSILNTFEVTQNKFYRFRLIGAQSLFAYKFSIDKHKLILIASDGQFVEQRTVDYIIIHTGERYDFLLHANQEISNYWIRAETLEVDNTERHTAEAILHYSTSETPDPNNKYRNVLEWKRECTHRKWCVAVNCPFKLFPPKMKTWCLHLDKLKAKIPSTQTPRIVKPGDMEGDLKFFNFGFEGMSSTSAINGKNFKFPTTPYQTYCDQYEADRKAGLECSEFDTSFSCINVEQIAESKQYIPGLYPSVNFVLSSVGNEKARNNNFSHPIHLHGHTFYVVAIRHGEYDKITGRLMDNNKEVDCHDELCPSPSWRDNKPPPFERHQFRVRKDAIRKDTVIVPAGGYVVIAFEADNPGYWFMHCHIEAHQLEGMAVIIQEYPTSQQWAPPPDINRIGNFNWSVDDFIKVTTAGKQCGVNTEP